MQITSRFTVALHVFACVEALKNQRRATSELLAESVGTNPVVIRKLLSQLSKAGLIVVARGTGGVEIVKPLSQITFYDVYRAVEPFEGDSLFHFHERPCPECPVGRNVHKLLDVKLETIQRAMEEEMKRHTIAELVANLRGLLEQENCGESSNDS